MAKIIAILEIYRGNGQGFKNKFSKYKKETTAGQKFEAVLASAIMMAENP